MDRESYQNASILIVGDDLNITTMLATLLRIEATDVVRVRDEHRKQEMDVPRANMV